MTSAPWNGRSLAIAISEDRVVLSPVGCRFVLSLLERYSRSEGIGLSPALLHLHQVLVPVANHSSGHADVRSAPARTVLADDEIGTDEAAELLGCSREHVGRLARAGVLGPTRVVGGRRVVSRNEVTAAASTRTITDEGAERA